MTERSNKFSESWIWIQTSFMRTSAGPGVSAKVDGHGGNRGIQESDYQSWEGHLGAMAALAMPTQYRAKKKEAQKVLDGLREQSQDRYIAPFPYGSGCIGLGDKDQAFENGFEKSCEQRDLGWFGSK